MDGSTLFGPSRSELKLEEKLQPSLVSVLGLLTPVVSAQVVIRGYMCGFGNVEGTDRDSLISLIRCCTLAMACYRQV